MGRTPGGDEWDRLARPCRAHALAGNDVPDVWIAAAVLARHGTLVTFDRGFRRWLSGSRLMLLAP